MNMWTGENQAKLCSVCLATFSTHTYCHFNLFSLLQIRVLLEIQGSASVNEVTRKIPKYSKQNNSKHKRLHSWSWWAVKNKFNLKPLQRQVQVLSFTWKQISLLFTTHIHRYAIERKVFGYTGKNHF